MIGRRQPQIERHLLSKDLLYWILDLSQCSFLVEKLTNFFGQIFLVFQQKGEMF